MDPQGHVLADIVRDPILRTSCVSGRRRDLRIGVGAALPGGQGEDRLAGVRKPT
jgi:hypothetical protein